MVSAQKTLFGSGHCQLGMFFSLLLLLLLISAALGIVGSQTYVSNTPKPTMALLGPQAVPQSLAVL